MNSVVLDASAILAVARREPGMESVLAVRAGALISAVNHTEVVSKLLRYEVPVSEINQFLWEAFPRVVPFDRPQAEIAGRLHAVTHYKNISYADCSCLALAQSRNLPVLTGDRKWLDLDVPVEVRAFR